MLKKGSALSIVSASNPQAGTEGALVPGDRSGVNGGGAVEADEPEQSPSLRAIIGLNAISVMQCGERMTNVVSIGVHAIAI